MKTNQRQYLWHIILMLGVAIVLYPIVFALSNSLRTAQEINADILSLIPESIDLSNYQYLAEVLPIFRISLNTFLMASVVTLLKLVTAFMAAYAITYFEFTGKNILYYALIASNFIPFTVTMIPNYMTIARMDLLDSILGVILPQLTNAGVVFQLVQTMRGIPISLIEAAKIDNVSESLIMSKIILPLCRSAIFSAGIWQFISTWNEYVWPRLLLRGEENYTLSIAMQNFVSAEAGTNFPVAMAISVISMLVPLLLYIVFQRYIIGSFISAGIK